MGSISFSFAALVRYWRTRYPEKQTDAASRSVNKKPEGTKLRKLVLVALVLGSVFLTASSALAIGRPIVPSVSQTK